VTTLNLTGELERLISDITARTPELHHIIPEKLLVCVSSGRASRGGSLAKIHPLRFAGGERSVKARRGRRSVLCTMPSITHRGEEMLYVIYFLIPRLRFAGGERSVKARRGRRSVLCTMPSITHRGEEMLYVIYFLIPRFLELSFREKMITIFHELYHISPACDGDIRRFPGRNYAHGSSTKSYNLLMGQLVDRYLETIPDRFALNFLEGDLAALRSRHSAIVARRLQAPRISITPA